MEYFSVFHGGVWNDTVYEGGRKEYIPIPLGGISYEELLCMIEVRTKKCRSMHVFEIDALVDVCPGKSGRMKITNQFELSCILGMGNLPTIYVTAEEVRKEADPPCIIRLNSVGSANSLNDAIPDKENSVVAFSNTSSASTSKTPHHRMQCESLVPIEESTVFHDVDTPSDIVPVGYIGQGSTFLDKDSLVSAVCLYHMKNFSEFCTKRSDRERYHLVCKFAHSCDFFLRARSFGNTWRIKEFRPHTCVIDLRNSACPQVRSKALAAHVGASLTEDGYVIRPKDIQGQILREFGVDVKYSTALSGRNIALHSSYGNSVESFQLLPRYLYMLQHLNPGSITDLKTTEDNSFQYCYFSLFASIRAFRSCRPVIVIDATHLKGKFKGVMLIATTKDSNENIVPLAFGVGDKESDASWIWFLEHVRSSFDVRDEMLIVSDQHVSIRNAVSSVFPGVAHGLCTYHIQGNLKQCRVEGAIEVFQQAARAYRVEDFEQFMANLRSNAVSVYEKLQDIDPVKWANCKCHVRRYRFGTSNAVESLNGCLKWARKLPICRLLEYCRNLVQEWFFTRRTAAAARTFELSENATKRLENASRVGRVMKVEPISDTKFKIVSSLRSNVVDLSARTCTCQVFQRDLFPCSHATRAIRFAKQNPCAYVSAYYSTANWLEIYSAEVMPVPDISDWCVPEEVALRVVIPPVNPKQAGRPRLNRVQAGGRVCSRCKQPGHFRNKCTTSLDIVVEEEVFVQQPEVKRRRKPMKCGICGVVGHTRRKCNHPSRDA